MLNYFRDLLTTLKNIHAVLVDIYIVLIRQERYIEQIARHNKDLASTVQTQTFSGRPEIRTSVKGTPL